MRNFTPLQEYFYYTRTERNAALILGLLCLFFVLLPEIAALFLGPKEKIDFTEFQRAIVALNISNTAEAPGGDAPLLRQSAPAANMEVRYFFFDPNNASKEEFILLGLSPKVAQTILNYRTKGGEFQKKEDLKKLYTLREEDYDRLEPWVRIASRPEIRQEKKAVAFSSSEQESKPYSERSSSKERDLLTIDINLATAEEWQQLKGIGPGYSRRIVNFREKLGGFSSVQQVAETYGLPDSTFQQILPSLKNSPIFRKIKVNSASEVELKGHPYLSNLQAKVLFNYRQQHGPFTDMADLRKIREPFEEQDWKRLKPYLSFE